MNCFEHPQKTAVGTCTNCGRGLCKECTSVVEGKLSCRGNCQAEVARARQLLSDSERAKSERTQAFAATAFFGLLFVIVGAALLFTQIAIGGALLIALGVILGIRGAGFARAGKKFRALAKEDRAESQKA